MKKIDKTNITGITPNKKKILKSLQGAASSPIDFNEIRDEQKYNEEYLIEQSKKFIKEYNSNLVSDEFLESCAKTKGLFHHKY
jgi:hypothetical protein